LACICTVACRPGLDDATATLAVPRSLPPFAALPQPAATLQRSQELTAEAREALRSGQETQALQGLTLALTTCPADPDARLELARFFATRGRSSVALELFKPVRAALASCGACQDLLQRAAEDPAFFHLRKTDEGAALFAGLPKHPLPWKKWATDAAAALQAGDPARLLPFIHSEFPYDLLRSCPACKNPAAQQVQRRTLTGPLAAGKIAQRFDTAHPEARGVPLDLAGEPTCTAGCCDWQASAPPAEKRVQLQRLCFWPVTPGRAALTAIALRYGPTDE